MPAVTTDDQITLGIQRIEPLDLHDPMVRAAVEQTRRSLSNPRLAAILTVRTAVQQYLCNRLAEDGYVHPPVYMLAGCTDPLNHWTYPARMNYYGAEVSITQSLILHKILTVMFSPCPSVFWASPNVRMEMRINRREYKYATEFMQVDFERAGATYDEMLACVSDLVRGLYRQLNERCAEALETVRGALLPALDDPLPVYDAVEETRKLGGLSSDDLERHLSAQTDGRPFLVVNMKREAYDHFDEASGRFLNFDIVIPPHGKNPNPVECLSGAERTRSVDSLKQRMIDLGYPMDYFDPFFQLFTSLAKDERRIACAGAGFGVERLTYAVLGLADIHDVYPFPRLAEGRIAF